MVYIFVTSERDLLKHRNPEEQIQHRPTVMSKNPAKICSYFVNSTDYRVLNRELAGRRGFLGCLKI